MKKKTLVFLIFSLFLLLGNSFDKHNIYAQGGSQPSCYELSGCSVINPTGQSWCVVGGTGSPCYGTPCDCS